MTNAELFQLDLCIAVLFIAVAVATYAGLRIVRRKIGRE